MSLEFLQAVFLCVVVGVFLYLCHLFFRATPRWQPLAGMVLTWVIATSVLAKLGFFEDFQALPPRIPMAVGAQTAGLIYLVFFSPWKQVLVRIPQRYILRLQSFRIFVEVILSALVLQRLLPIEMSYHGRNFDIVSGILALLFARVVIHTGEVKSRPLILLFNVVGLGSLANVMLIGMMAAPYPNAVLHLDPPTGLVAMFPFQLLPLFLVPVAIFLHLISLRRAWNLKSEVDALERPGAGMSPIEYFVARFLVLPTAARNSSVEDGLKAYERESQNIADLLARPEVKAHSEKRVLIAPILGLEDSSRNWSVAETLEHINIVSSGMAELAIGLSNGRKSEFKADTAKVKPHGKRVAPTSAEFLSESQELVRKIRAGLGKELDGVTHRHPWFGEVSARKWILILGIHHGVHRRQLERILEGL